jgi:hypothetical protein
VYGLLDLLGDLGGVLEFIVVLVGLLIIPFSSYSFNLKAFQKLFLANTKDESVF